MKASIACNVRWGIYIESGIKKMEFQRSVDHKRLNQYNLYTIKTQPTIPVIKIRSAYVICCKYFHDKLIKNGRKLIKGLWNHKKLPKLQQPLKSHPWYHYN